MSLKHCSVASMDAAHEQGRIFLNRLRESAIAAGVGAPDLRQRHGELETMLVEQRPEAAGSGP